MDNGASKSVLVLGGRGRFGLAAVQAFAASGWRVFAQIRPGAPEPDVAGVSWLPVGPEDGATLVQAARGAAVVVHALNPVYTRWKAHALPLLEAGAGLAKQLGAVLMLPGNVYNYGAGMPSVLTEHTPQAAHTRKGKIRIAMERHLQQAAAAGDVRSVVIRAGDFFGAGTGSWFDKVLARDITRGKMVYPGALDVPTAWAYLPDLAKTFVRVAGARLDAPGRFAPFETLHFKGYTLSGSDWADQLGDAAWDHGWLQSGDGLEIGSLPWRILRAGGLLVPMWRELAEMRYLWQTPHALSGDKLATLIGPEPHTELSLAVQHSLKALGKLRHTGCSAAAWA